MVSREAVPFKVVISECLQSIFLALTGDFARQLPWIPIWRTVVSISQNLHLMSVSLRPQRFVVKQMSFSSCQVKNGVKMKEEKSHVDPLASSFHNSVLSKCCRSFCPTSLQLFSYRWGRQSIKNRTKNAGLWVAFFVWLPCPFWESPSSAVVPSAVPCGPLVGRVPVSTVPRGAKCGLLGSLVTKAVE